MIRVVPPGTCLFGSQSRSFHTLFFAYVLYHSGTKQGGILSPDFFAMYMHDLIELLRASGFGCHVIRMCLAYIFFADDIVLLSPSRYGLQALLNICVSYCKKYCLDFNVKKSKVMIVGKRLSNTDFLPLMLNDTPLEFVSDYKYLGVNIHADKALSFTVTDTLRAFHRAANSLLCSRVKPNNGILLKLLYTNCVPIITYSCAVREFSSADMYRCHVAVNNALPFTAKHLRHSYREWIQIDL